MNAFTKVVRPAYTREEGSIFCTIKWDGSVLSSTGVIVPKVNGDCRGSCGQIIMGFKEYDERGYRTLADVILCPGWDKESLRKFFDVWDRWHLNDMRAGSPVQEEYLRQNPIHEYLDHYGKACAVLKAAGLNPDSNGYSYGHAWKHEDVPADVLEFLAGLPDSDKALPGTWSR